MERSLTDTVMTMFEDVRVFAAGLETIGMPVWKSRLIDAIEGGSTGGEILMAIRWNLQESLHEEKELPVTIRQRAEELIPAITSTGI